MLIKNSLRIACLFLLACLPQADATEILGEHAISLSGWKARDPQIVSVEDTGAELVLKYGKFADRWQVVDGPEIPVPARTPFFRNRRCRLSLEIKASGLDGYAVQIRIRQRKGDQKTGGAFSRNLSPRQEWDSAAELSKAEKFRTWAKLEGTSTIHPGTDKLALEIWVSSPQGTAPAKVSLRNIQLTEMAEIEHVFSSEPATPGNLFFTDSGGMKVDFVDADKVKSARLELFDETGKALAKVEGGSGVATLKIPLEGIGYYAVKASADYPDGKSIVSQTTAAVLGAPLEEAIRRQSRLGTFRVWGDLDIWLKSGANWEWGIGGIDLSEYVLNPDGTISPPKGAKPLTYAPNYKNIFTIGALPKWVMPDSAPPGTLMAPKDWGLFERLIEAFARQNPDLPWFCSYNEPDAHWRGSAEDFVKFHQVIAAGVKKGNPRMKFFGPCMYSIRMNDFRKYAEMGLLDCLDGLVMHAYVNGSSPEGKFIENVTEMAQYLKDTGRGNMPVYITEYGWCADIGDWQKTITETERSQYAPRSIALLATQPLDAIEYFVFKHDSEPGKPGYSMLYSDNTPTPTYVAFVNTLKWLGWTRRGDGRWFAFSPQLNMTLFHREGKNTGVAWNANGPGRLELPSTPLRMTDSMGRDLPVEGTSLAVGPAPVFFELPDSSALFNAQTLPEIMATPGEKFTLPWAGGVAAPEITLSGAEAAIVADAAPGNYLILGKSGEAMQVQPIKVLSPLKVESLDFSLSPQGDKLLASARVESPMKSGADVVLKLTLNNGEVAETRAHLSPNLPAKIELAVPGFQVGSRLQGKLAISLEGEAPIVVEKEVDQTVIYCPSVQKVDWKAIAGVDFSSWSPFPQPLKAEDCSASFKTAVTPEGFRLQVDVLDDSHHQSQLPSYLWNGDSIQVAFDVDADKEWQPNNVGNGYNGHRILEYGISLPNKGGPAMVWRFRADAPGFSSGAEEPRIVAKVTREGTHTLYDILFPWPTLGLDQAPKIGSKIGFALVVNDLDGGAEVRHGLRIFSGIMEGKNPEGFGRLYVKELKP